MREFLTTLIFGNIIDDLCYRTSIFTISQNADGWIMRFLKKNEEYEDDSSTAKDENSDQDDVEQERILRKLIGLRKWSNQLLNCFVSYIKSAIAQSMIVIKFGATDNPDNVQVPKILKRLFKLLYYTMKICGYKTIVSDLEPTFYFMLLQDPKDYNGWETRYVLLIWLSLISMIPFDLKTVDSRTSTGSDKIPLVENMIRLSKFYLEATGKERDGAAILLSRLLTRCDMAEKYLNNYVQWERDEARNNKDVFTITGIFTSLCAIYKLGQRQSLLPTLETAWQCLFILEENQMFTNNALVRKMLVKLAQGFGLCYLKPKIASWNNLQTTSKPNIDPSNIQKSLKEEGEEDEEIPDHIEEIIEILLNGLKHKDTVVHWSAAKGLGRLSQCLPQELADDVIGSLFELFSENAYNEITWLLLPERLKEVIPWAIKALTFDLKLGSHSIAPHVPELANSLVVASVFDCEVNVRRASSATFQENVRRLGIFPHGIEIITMADYFTVGNRVNAFLEISVKIAKLLQYLIGTKLLCSKALYNSAFLDINYMVNNVLHLLIPQVLSHDMHTRHGGLLAAGEISLAWSEINGNDRSWVEIHKKLIEEISYIINY
ncbi:15288_t:CDS:10 [Entrophospora sp. SA101]|nr:15288_t:CDS:10 [Entrophospora sp. SA101]